MKLITTYGLNTKRWYKHAACTILMLLVALLSTACSNSESYPGLEWDVDKTGTEEDPNGEGYGVVNDEDGKVEAGRIPVRAFLSEQSLITTTATRGTGPFVVPAATIADSLRYVRSLFHLFAFRSTKDAQGGLTYDASFQSHANPDDKAKDCLVDGYVNELGMPFKLKPDHSGTVIMKRQDMETDTAMYYYIENGEVGYNFYAYHIDDFKPTASNTHRTADQISYDLEIDGTQDIMLGSAPPLTDSVYKAYFHNLSLSEKEKNKVLNIGNYSRYSAMYGINPVITVHHQLTRFRFEAYPSDEDANNVNIKELKVNSRYKGNMVVVDRNMNNLGVTWDDERKDVYLMDYPKTGRGTAPCVALPDTGFVVSWEEGMSTTNWKENRPTVVGADMLLPPDSIFTLELKYDQKLKSGVTAHRTVSQRMKAPAISQCVDSRTGGYWFPPGYVFTVKIAVYGLKPILVSVDVTGWNQGEDIHIDPLKSRKLELETQNMNKKLSVN